MSKLKSMIVGEYGKELIVNVGIDFTGYDSLTLSFELPDGTVVDRTSAADGVSDGGDATLMKVHYVTDSGDAADITANPGVVKVHPKIIKTGVYLKIGTPPARFVVAPLFQD